MINNICECPSRLVLIVQQVETILRDEPLRRFLILSERKCHLGMLKTMLNDKGITDCGFFFGGMKEKQLRESEACQFILATMQMTSEGFDKKGLDTLILGSPKSDVIQIVGRILRDKKEDRKHVPLVLDIIDEFSVFVNQAKKRRAYYKKMKFVLA
jgi:superfamily II DNA or RNA helicase